RPQDTLALINDVLQAAIVIFGVAVVLYNLRHVVRDRVTRAFNSLLLFVVIVYFSELMATRAAAPLSSEQWLRLEWIGIAMVPAALFHLADALLVTTGDISRGRRMLVRVWYLLGIAVFCFAIFSDLLVTGLEQAPQAPHLATGPLFGAFFVYYWLLSALCINNVWRARERCITYTTRKRMSVIFVTSLAAPLAVFPYLLLSRNIRPEISIAFWLLLIAGNIVISVMFAFLTDYIAYIGANSPDRDVRVRLFKYMARVPLAAMIVLLVYVLVVRTGSIFGLAVETAVAISVVATVILVEWTLHVLKRPLERFFQLTDEPEVRRIQQLSERVMTTRDMNQFLESVLAATCEVIRTPTAFVAVITSEGPKLESVVGPLGSETHVWAESDLQELAEQNGDGFVAEGDLKLIGGFLIWQDFWIRPLRSGLDNAVLGILGIRAISDEPNLTEVEIEAFDRLVAQATKALEDRILQLEVFAAVEGLLPEVTSLQQRRSKATFGGTTVLTAPESSAILITDPQFNNMVWDALSHYWGGPKLSESPLVRLQIVQRAIGRYEGNSTKALRAILAEAVEQQRPEGERNMTTAEWILYNILELKFIQGLRVRDVARRLAMSESDLYRKQRVAIESVAQTINVMEDEVVSDSGETESETFELLNTISGSDDREQSSAG
ncbi:MAG TPA: hypothetical protein VFI27_21700, partial [candidate division Zixibacteria bacterium]|nr:hypothetical protein [candidate division Zixibacteria bacterium]